MYKETFLMMFDNLEGSVVKNNKQCGVGGSSISIRTFYLVSYSRVLCDLPALFRANRILPMDFGCDFTTFDSRNTWLDVRYP